MEYTSFKSPHARPVEPRVAIYPGLSVQSREIRLGVNRYQSLSTFSMATKRIRGDRWEFTIKRKKILGRPFSISFNTEAEGIAVCVLIEQQLDAGIIPPEIRDRATANKDKVETLLQAVRRYELAMAVPDSDRLLLDTVVGQIGHIRLERVTYPWVEAWITDLKREQVLAPTTIRHYVGALGRCLDYHVRRETIERNPIRLLPKKFASYNDADRQAVQVRVNQHATASPAIAAWTTGGAAHTGCALGQPDPWYLSVAGPGR